MKAVIQRVDCATLCIDGKVVSSIDKGLVVYVGFKEGEELDKMDFFVRKICGLRIFEDENGKLNLSLNDVGGQMLIVSNFTLYANCSHGYRPDLFNAMRPEKAQKAYENFVEKVKAILPGKVQTGVFGADMFVNQINNGPINIVFEV